MIKKINIAKREPWIRLCTDLVFSQELSVSRRSGPLRMDLLLPDLGRATPGPAPVIDGPLPVVLYFAGGAFRHTEKDLWIPALSYFAEHGYAVATAEYHLSNVASFPQQIIDAKCAVRFLRANAESFNIDPDRIAVMGDSAGGYLSVMTGVTSGIDEFESREWGGVSSAVQAVCDWFAPIDFLTLEPDDAEPGTGHLSPVSPEALFLGKPISEDPELCRRASALTYVSPASPPTIIFHGTDDKGVTPQQSVSLHDALQSAGVPVELYLVEGAGHVSLEFGQREMMDIIVSFLDSAMPRR